MEKRNNAIIDFGNITDNDLYITDKNDKDVPADIDDVVDLSVSWASLVEEELGGSLNDKKLSGSMTNVTSMTNATNATNATNVTNVTNVTNTPELDVKTVLGSDIKSLDDLVILEYQTFLSGHLRKYIKNLIDNFSKDQGKFNETEFLEKLKWLQKSSKSLSDKLKLPTYQNENKTDKMFQRSSYKFCSYNYECEFNYNVKKYRGCFAQHYVHNIVYADITTLINCIIKLDKINIELLRELKKSMSTISFVVNHMYEELKSVLLVSKKPMGHINRKTSRKKTGNKRRRR